MPLKPIAAVLALLFAGPAYADSRLTRNPGYGGATLDIQRFDSRRQCLEERHFYSDEPTRDERRHGAFLECLGPDDE